MRPKRFETTATEMTRKFKNYYKCFVRNNHVIYILYNFFLRGPPFFSIACKTSVSKMFLSFSALAFWMEAMAENWSSLIPVFDFGNEKQFEGLKPGKYGIYTRVSKYWNRFFDQKLSGSTAVCERFGEMRKNCTKQSNACNRFTEATQNVFIEFGINGVVLGITNSLCLTQGWIDKNFSVQKNRWCWPSSSWILYISLVVLQNNRWFTLTSLINFFNLT